MICEIILVKSNPETDKFNQYDDDPKMNTFDQSLTSSAGLNDHSTDSRRRKFLLEIKIALFYFMI